MRGRDAPVAFLLQKESGDGAASTLFPKGKIDIDIVEDYKKLLAES